VIKAVIWVYYVRCLSMSLVLHWVKMWKLSNI